MQSPLLSINNLSVTFNSEEGSTPTLQNIDIEIAKGELVAIVGESGSGKSVTSLSVLQLLPQPPAKYLNGSILLYSDNNTINILETPKHILQNIRGNKIAMIFQEPMTSLNPVLTCGNQVMEAICLHKKLSKKIAKAQTIDLFKKVKLPNADLLFNRYPHEISGGQKQRVMIAMAMSCEPDLLICDEPTTALDVTVQKNVLELIKELQIHNNMGVIFITHDLSVVAEIADKIVVMYKGKIVETGTVQTIFKTPKHPYTKALLACRPALYPKNTRLPIVSDFMNDDGTEKELIQKFPTISSQEIEMNTAQLPKQEAILSVEHLKVYYPSKKTFLGKITAYNKAVDDVSFSVYKGETLGLVGESGCGKSTLGRAILRLIESTEGNVFFENENLIKASAATLKSLRKKMQIIFQDPYSSLNPRLTIGEAIEEPLLVHKILPTKQQRKEKVMELLQKVNLLPEHYNRYPHEFSGGQRQRIVIARALALEPTFIVCDESVSALDVSVQAQVLNLLNDLKKDFGFTAIFISHDLSVVRYISDRIMVMQKGKIVEMGKANDIYNNPANEYTQKLIASIPKIV
ncbi:MAG: ABC transporter ATP-binding protein [Chitinophagaceae bacterium]|jgi:peptide/nickel transport system ATP-binding protein|nr:ABC transporter ATP-binding protein [Chitinophagaceae bacterium]MBP9740034.1 ABC transporter ATP-binding protein [Chitinophagaceae bacterium]